MLQRLRRKEHPPIQSGSVTRSLPSGSPAADGVDDGAIVVAAVPGQLEEFWQGHADLAEEGSVAAAAVHEFGREFATELEAGLGDQARKPRDAVDGVGLGGQCLQVDAGHGGQGGRHQGEVAEPDALDGEDGVEGGIAAVTGVVLDEVEEFLFRAADGGEEGPLGRFEEAVGGLASRGEPGEGLVPELGERGFPIERGVGRGGAHGVEGSECGAIQSEWVGVTGTRPLGAAGLQSRGSIQPWDA